MCQYNKKINYEKELINYIKEKTNIEKQHIQEVILCYKMCMEEDLNLDSSVYYQDLILLTGYKYETIKTIMQGMTSYEEMLM